MSRAFVKESDGDDGAELPELLVSPHRNLVTPAGLAQIEANVQRLQAALSDARTSEDHTAVPRIQRDLRYWTERLRTAEVVAAPHSSGTVRFGSTVLLARVNGTRVEFRIVGEDEAAPRDGKISYVSPIAESLIGAAVGEIVPLAEGEAEILQVR